MPRGAEYDDGVPHSDNAIEAGENKVHGGEKTTEEAEVYRAKKTAPLPDLSEVNDRVASGGAATGHHDGSGDNPSKPHSDGLRKDFGRKELNNTIDTA